jgi:hypothetical protein
MFLVLKIKFYELKGFNCIFMQIVRFNSIWENSVYLKIEFINFIHFLSHGK